MMDQRAIDRAREIGVRIEAQLAFAGWKSVRTAGNGYCAVPRGQLESFICLVKRRAAWLDAKSGRRLLVRRSPRLFESYCWMVLLEEDEKGVVQVRGRSWREAVGQALRLVSPRAG
jgi:hypothetical protein